jgi:probable F420-dependent oxidoreductase
MKVDTRIVAERLADVPASARRAEALGYDVAWADERTMNPLTMLALAAEHTREVALLTNILVAFPRSPMVVAYEAWSLQDYSGGRLQLGLGSQVRGHIVRRFSVPWSPPVPRMREYIRALREIWRAFQEERPPRFEGAHYQFSLMNPEFRPKPIAHPQIPILVAGLNPNMCRLAGELCDGLRPHSFCTRKYLTEVILPNIDAGLQRSGRRRSDIAINAAAFMALGRTDAEVEQAIPRVRRQIAFFGATRSYHPVLRVHGWEQIGQQLYALSRDAAWDEMTKLVSDEMLETFAVIARYDQFAARLRERFAGLVDLLRFEMPEEDVSDDLIADVVRQLQQIPAAGEG